MSKPSFRKVVVSGHVYEVYDFEKPAFTDFESNGGRRGGDEEKSDREVENRKLSCYRAREKVRRLVNANFSDVRHVKFTTNTFRDGELENVWDVEEANMLFKKFIMRLKYWLKKHGVEPEGGLQYIAVVEFQDANGRGAVHYHMMSNLPYIRHSDFEKVWRYGFVGINSLQGKYRKDGKDVDNTGAYMIKYMLKDVNDPRLKGKKSYLCSRGLQQPRVYRADKADMLIDAVGLDQMKTVFGSEYESEHHGTITYSEYNLRRCGANTAD